MTKKYRDFYVPENWIATAVFNLLEQKGYIVNRKKGLMYGVGGERWASVGRRPSVKGRGFSLMAKNFASGPVSKFNHGTMAT
jgi:hypothetical protein